MFKVEESADGVVTVTQRISAKKEYGFSVEYLKLFLTLHSLSRFLRDHKLAPEYGPCAPAVVFPPEMFDAFRDAMVADASCRRLFTPPRRKRPNMSLRRTMLAGVAIVSMEALPDHIFGAWSPCRPLPRKASRPKDEGAIPAATGDEDDIPF